MVQFVKESEGREARAKDNPAEGIPRDSNFSHWIVGIGASVAAALVVVVAIQVTKWKEFLSYRLYSNFDVVVIR